MKKQTTLLGLFIIAFCVGCSWLILFLKPSLGDGKLSLHVRFSSINKINTGSRVHFAGKPVGHVRKITAVPNARQLPPDEQGKPFMYELLLEVDSSVSIYTYDEITYTMSGLLGETSIAILPKEPPPGTTAEEITHQTLYGHATNTIEDLLIHFQSVTTHIEHTLSELNAFLANNQETWSTMLDHAQTMFAKGSEVLENIAASDLVGKMTQATETLHTALSHVNETLETISKEEMVAHITGAMEQLECMTRSMTSPSSTLGKLLTSDAAYLQMTASLQKLETLLNDVNHYGLLFQYDKAWQKKRASKRKELACLQSPCDFYLHLNNEILDISVILNRMQTLIECLQCKELSISDQDVLDKFRELLNKSQNIERRLEIYNEKMLSDYYHKQCGEES